jgi:hypothetical protein
MVVGWSTNLSSLEFIIVSRLKVKPKSMVYLVNHARKTYCWSWGFIEGNFGAVA